MQATGSLLNPEQKAVFGTVFHFLESATIYLASCKNVVAEVRSPIYRPHYFSLRADLVGKSADELLSVFQGHLRRSRSRVMSHFYRALKNLGLK